MSLDHSQSQPQQPLWRQLEIEPQASNTAAQLDPMPVPKPVVGKFKVAFMTPNPANTIAHARTHTSSNAIMGPKIDELCLWQQTQLLVRDECIGFLEHQIWHHRLLQNKMSQPKPADLRLLSFRQHATRVEFGTKEKYSMLCTGRVSC